MRDAFGAETEIVPMAGHGHVLHVSVPPSVADKDASLFLRRDLDWVEHHAVYEASFSFLVAHNGFESAGVGMFKYVGPQYSFEAGVASFEEGNQLNSLFKEGNPIAGTPSRWHRAQIRVVTGDTTAKSRVTVDGILVREEVTSGFDHAGPCELSLGVFYTSTPHHPGAAEIFFDDILLSIKEAR